MLRRARSYNLYCGACRRSRCHTSSSNIGPSLYGSGTTGSAPYWLPLDWSHPTKPAKLKALLRTATARTVLDLWAAIREAFTRFKPDECRNYLAAAGYDAYDPA